MNRRVTFFAKTVTLLFYLLLPEVRAGENNKHLFWINTGLSIDLLDPAGASVGSVSGSYQYNRHLLSVRYSYNTIHYELLADPSVDDIRDIGLLYGIVFKKPFGFISASTGIAYVGGQDRGDEYTVDFLEKTYVNVRQIHTVGLPVALQVFWTPFRFVGLGLYGFVNINPETTCGGLNLHLQIGRLKTRQRER